MKNEKIIKEIADPILEQLEKYEDMMGDQKFHALPEIRFVMDKSFDGPIMIGDVELTEELIQQLEAYLQEQIETNHKPTVLH